MNTPLSYEKLVNVLSQLPPKPPIVEVWIIDYLPSGQVFKVILEDLPLVEGFLLGTEEIYLLSRKDFSMEMAEMLRGVNIPVFGPNGMRLG
jgi:hypothetical protein